LNDSGLRILFVKILRDKLGADGVARLSQHQGSEEADRLAARRKCDGFSRLFAGFGEVSEKPFTVSAKRQPRSGRFVVVSPSGGIRGPAGQLAGFCSNQAACTAMSAVSCSSKSTT
jgi:hypothetical protein